MIKKSIGFLKIAALALGLSGLAPSLWADATAMVSSVSTPIQTPALSVPGSDGTVYGFEADSLQGKPVTLSQYQGKVLLIVNVASKCGFTPQYKGLEALYEKYKDKGFVILGFPCNQFAQQEPGTAAEIATFCKANYGVTFPLFAKIEVNGPGTNPLYQFLKKTELDPAGKEPIGWNFNKFLIDRQGHPLHRYVSQVKPEDIDADINKLVTTK
jgi:glutathione peroxidase-family protein